MTDGRGFWIGGSNDGVNFHEEWLSVEFPPGVSFQIDGGSANDTFEWGGTFPSASLTFSTAPAPPRHRLLRFVMRANVAFFDGLGRALDWVIGGGRNLPPDE